VRKASSRVLERHRAREAYDFGGRYVGRHANAADCGTTSHVVDHHDCLKADALLPNPQDFRRTEIIFNVGRRYLHKVPPEAFLLSSCTRTWPNNRL
jgi:hypothetical protein